MNLKILFYSFIALQFSPTAYANDIAVGDSIAYGIGHSMGIKTRAKIGASSCYIKSHFTPIVADRVVISAGVNDPPGRCISSLRDSIKANHVVWIRPINAAGHTVDLVAREHGDTVIAYTIGKDNLHPASYSIVADHVRNNW